MASFISSDIGIVKTQRGVSRSEAAAEARMQRRTPEHGVEHARHHDTRSDPERKKDPGAMEPSTQLSHAGHRPPGDLIGEAAGGAPSSRRSGNPYDPVILPRPKL